MGKLLREIAKRVLGEEEAKRIWKRIEIIGDIAIIRRPFNYPIDKLKLVAQELLKTIPNIKSVWLATSEVKTEFRIREYTHLAGELRSETIYKEHGCSFKLDIRKVYVSPRLNYEHARIAKLVKPGEVIINMFAGIGTFSIIIAKYSKPRKIYSIDINPDAYNYMVENVKLNNVEEIVKPILGDAAKVIMERLTSVADRVIMPLPGLCYEYLEYAIMGLKKGIKGYIHVYDFTEADKGEDPIAKVKEKFREKLSGLGIKHHVIFKRIVRTVGPRKYQVVLDIEVQKT